MEKMRSVHALLKLAQLRWTGNVIRMPDERRQRKSSMENFRMESVPRWPKECYKDILRASLRDFIIPTGYTGSNKLTMPHQ